MAHFQTKAFIQDVIKRNNLPKFDFFQEHGENISGIELHSILSEIDTNNNGQVELEEYLQVQEHKLCVA